MNRDELVVGQWYKQHWGGGEFVKFIAPVKKCVATHVLTGNSKYYHSTCCTSSDYDFVPMTPEEIEEVLHLFPEEIQDKYRSQKVNNSYQLF